MIVVKDDITFVLDEIAVFKGPPECAESVCRVIVVVVTKDLLQCPGHTLAIVMRDRRDQVVGNVVVRNVMQEEATRPTEKWSINSRNGTSNKGPCVLTEVRHRRVGVMQVSEHDDPVVREEVRDDVKLCDSSQVGNPYPISDGAAHSKKAKVRHDDFLLLLLLEQCGTRRIMVGVVRVKFLVAESVVRKVRLHSNRLHEKNTNKGPDGSFLKHFSIVLLSDFACLGNFEVRSCGWDKVLITLYRSGRLVMKVMRVAPCEVRNKEEGMESEPNDGVNPTRRGNDTMTSLVS